VVKHIILEKAVGRTHIAQVLDSLDYMKKVLITNKVTTHFFITSFKSIPYTLHALPTAFSRIIAWLGLCCFLPGTAMGASFSVTVDHTVTGHDHTLQLAARLEGSSDNFTLDVTPLAKSFYVTAEPGAQRAGLWREKRYRIGAKRTGVLGVPALEVTFHGKKLRSQPFSVKVLDINGKVDDVRLWVEAGISHREAWLHQQLLWQMTVVGTYPFAGAPKINLPSFDGFDVQKEEGGVSGERVVNGRRLYTKSWYVLLYPRHTGSLLIARPVVSARLSQWVKTHRFAAGNPNFDAGEALVHVRKSAGSEQRVHIRVLPLSAEHLPVGRLILASDIPDTHIHAGEPLTWNIHLTGKKMRKSDMPDLRQRLPLDGPFSVIREKPLVSVRNEGYYTNVNALYRMVLTPSTPGVLRLPAIDIPFFDSDRGRIEHASLTSRTLRVLPPRKSSNNEGFEISSVNPEHEYGGRNSAPVRWKGLAIGMFVIWLVTLAAWFFSGKAPITLRRLPLRRHGARASSLRRVLAARDSTGQFSGIKDILNMPGRVTPLGLLAHFPDLREGGGEIAAWLESLECGRWQHGNMPPPLDGKHVRKMVRIVRAALEVDAKTSETFKPADFGRIGG